jgi:hypothetical protein
VFPCAHLVACQNASAATISATNTPRCFQSRIDVISKRLGHNNVGITCDRYNRGLPGPRAEAEGSGLHSPRRPLRFPRIKNCIRAVRIGCLGQEQTGSRHRENPYTIGLFSSPSERPGPLGGTSNIAFLSAAARSPEKALPKGINASRDPPGLSVGFMIFRRSFC